MLGFIIAVVAGFLTPYAETPLARPVAAVMGDRVPLEAGELRVLAFIIVMLLAGVAANLLHSGSAFWIILGGAVGYFGTRLVSAAQGAMDKRG